MEETKQSSKKIILEYVRVILFTILGTYIVLLFFQVSSVSGISMEPTYQDGDIVIIEKFFYKQGQPEHDDIVVADYIDEVGESTHIIKRVVGLPGDMIEIKDGKLYRNGELVIENYIKEDMVSTDLIVNVPEGKVFLMGDNRNASLDSRAIGYIDFKESVIGKVIIDTSNLF